MYLIKCHIDQITKKIVILFNWTSQKTHVILTTMDLDALPTPWRTQMWVQVKDNGRGRSEIAPARTPATLEPNNFANRPRIGVWSKAKLYLLLRAFQQYVACRCNQVNRVDSRLFLVGSQTVRNFRGGDRQRKVTGFWVEN